MIVDSGLRFRRADVPEEVVERLSDKYVHRNPSYNKLKAMGFATKGEPPTLNSIILTDEEVRLTRGGIVTLKRVLKDAGIPFRLEDRRLTRPLENRWTYRAPFKVDADQVAARDKLVRAEQGLVEGVCGSGKTEVLLMTAAEVAQWTLVSVHTERLQRQWVQRIQSRFGLGVDDIGIYSGKQKMVRPITIVMQRTLYENAEALGRHFGMFCQDEVHHSAARTFYEGIDFFPGRYRYGATATLKRKDGKGFLVHDLFGQVLYQITDEDLEREGRVHVPEVVLVPTNFYYAYNEPESDDPRERARVRWEKRQARRLGEADAQEGAWGGYINAATADRERNALVWSRVKRDYAAGRSALLLSDRREHCFVWKRELEKAGIECGLLVGARGKKERDELDRTLDRIATRELRVAVGTTIADEGLDAPVLDRLHLLCPTAGNKGRFEQQRGRVKRKAEGKTDARVYYYWDWRIPDIYEHYGKIRRACKVVTLDEAEAARYDDLAKLRR